jgi:hypothetical protein
MGEDAEGVLIDGNILINALNCNCYLCFLDRTGDGDDLVILTADNSNVENYDSFVFHRDNNALNTVSSNALATIYLLLQPGHYDMLYARFLKFLFYIIVQ